MLWSEDEAGQPVSCGQLRYKQTASRLAGFSMLIISREGRSLEQGDKITAANANKWALCRLALQAERHAALTAFTRPPDEHCAIHCASKEAADGVQLPGSDTLAEMLFFLFFLWDKKLLKAKVCVTGRAIFSRFLLMCHGLLDANEFRGQHLIAGCVFPPSMGKCQADNAAVCHPAAHLSPIPP